MALLTETQIRRLERQYPAGLSSAAIVETFKGKSQRFSEPTLRKYVQLGLLPTSRRVGKRGRFHGSSGIYPVVVVRLINEIKRALDAGRTLEEIRRGYVGLMGEVTALERGSAHAFSRFDEALAVVAKGRERRLHSLVRARERSLGKELKALSKLAERLGKETQLL